MTQRTHPERSAAQFAEHRRDLNRRLRAAFLAGNEERFRKEQGRGLTEAELRRVIEWYPGDLPTARRPDSGDERAGEE